MRSTVGISAVHGGEDVNASVFYRRGLIETWARGMLKIASLMQEAGLPAPTVGENTGFVTLVFPLPPQRGGVNGGVSGGVSGGVGVEPDTLLLWIGAHPGLKVADLAKRAGKSPRTMERWLKQLRDSQSIEFRGAPKTGGYYLKVDSLE